MGEINRIRWQEMPEASIVHATGHVGTLDPLAFKIFPPTFAGEEWMLTSELPGQQAWRLYGDDPEALKKGAEAWLVEFAASLGASFPEPEAGQ